jgi:hypothetical protein
MTHILSSLRCDLGKMHFKRFIVLTFHLSFLSSARLRGRPLWGISNPWPPIQDITCEAGTVHLIPLNLTMITLCLFRGAQFGMLYACCDHSPLL